MGKSTRSVCFERRRNSSVKSTLRTFGHSLALRQRSRADSRLLRLLAPRFLPLTLIPRCFVLVYPFYRRESRSWVSFIPQDFCVLRSFSEQSG